ncbi:MAG: enhanced serine sensitivity protein SseB C-terminal domain-containing protein [Dokdonella sp.]
MRVIQVAETRALLVAIESDRQDAVIMHDTGAVRRDTLNEPDDLMFIASNDGSIGQHIVRDVPPFYERTENRH